MNGKVWNTRVTRKIEEKMYKAIIDVVLSSLMCCLIRTCERERNC